MEGFILVGAFLALPLIYIGTQPPAKLKVDAPEETEEEEPSPIPIKLAERDVTAARERQERILQHMTPRERELLNEYLTQAREKGSKGKEDISHIWDSLMAFLLCGLFIVMIWAGFTQLDFLYNPKKLSV